MEPRNSTNLTTNKRLSHLEEQLRSMDNKLSKVVDALVGNDLTKQGGVVAQIAVLEEKIKMLEKDLDKEKEFRKKIIYGLTAIVTLFTAITYILTNYNFID